MKIDRRLGAPVALNGHQWSVEEMCRRDADRFLSSIERKVHRRRQKPPKSIEIVQRERHQSYQNTYKHDRTIASSTHPYAHACDYKSNEGVHANDTKTIGERSVSKRDAGYRQQKKSEFLRQEQQKQQRTLRQNSGSISGRTKRPNVIERRLKHSGGLGSSFILSDLHNIGDEGPTQRNNNKSKEEREVEQTKERKLERGEERDANDNEATRLQVQSTTYITNVSTSNVVLNSDKAYTQHSLWKLLWERRWEWAEERLHLYPEEAKHPVDLHQIIGNEITKSNTDDKNNIEDSVYPLHLACWLRPLPPTSLVRKLIDVYPKACVHPHPSSGLLPIHMAVDLSDLGHSRYENAKSSNSCRNIHRHGDIVSLLLDQHPESILMKDNLQQMTPMHVAASTASAENGVVTPVAARVFEVLVAASEHLADNCNGPLATTCRDKHGLTPSDWAWHNVDYYCSRCGRENMTTRGSGRRNAGDYIEAVNNEGKNDDDSGEKLFVHNASIRCECHQVVSVARSCVHPLLRTEIYSHLNLAETKNTPNADANATKISLSTSTSNVSEHVVGPAIRYEPIEDFMSLPPIKAWQQQKQGSISIAHAPSIPQRISHLPKSRMDMSGNDGMPTTAPFLWQQTINGFYSSNYQWNDKDNYTFAKAHYYMTDDSSPNEDQNRGGDDLLAGLERDQCKDREEQEQIEETSTLSPRSLEFIMDQVVDARTIRSESKIETTATLRLKIHLSELIHPSQQGRRRRNGVNDRSLSRKNRKIPVPYFELFAAHRSGMSKTFYKSYPILRGSTEGTWEDAFLDLGLTHEQLQNGTHGAGHVEVGFRVMHCPKKGSGSQLIGTCQVSLETLERQQRDLLMVTRCGRDDVTATHSLQEPEKLPILNGFEVTGRLQVLSLSIE